MISTTWSHRGTGKPSLIERGWRVCSARPSGKGNDGHLTAQPAGAHHPDDPVEILAVLPARWHRQFLADYHASLTSAHRPGHYQQLRRTLRLWRLRAAAYSDPGFEARLEAARDGTQDGTPIEQIVPDWDSRVAAARQRRSQQ
jgi:hypothetical protein